MPNGLIDLPRIFGEDPLREGIWDKLGEMIRLLLDTELKNALEAARYAPTEEQKSSHNGTKPEPFIQKFYSRPDRRTARPAQRRDHEEDPGGVPEVRTPQPRGRDPRRY